MLGSEAMQIARRWSHAECACSQAQRSSRNWATVTLNVDTVGAMRSLLRRLRSATAFRHARGGRIGRDTPCKRARSASHPGRHARPRSSLRAQAAHHEATPKPTAHRTPDNAAQFAQLHLQVSARCSKPRVRFRSSRKRRGRSRNRTRRTRAVRAAICRRSRLRFA
jgi:hypothetical protein